VELHWSNVESIGTQRSEIEVIELMDVSRSDLTIQSFEECKSYLRLRTHHELVSGEQA
jgi:hypothetical protein